MTLGPDEAVPAAAAIMRAAKKSGHAWIGDRLVWCAWLDDSFVIATGGPEQPVDLPASVVVTLADSSGAAALRLTAAADTLAPGSDDWDAAAALLAERRLNGAGQAAGLATRWATESTITRLTIVDGEFC